VKKIIVIKIGTSVLTDKFGKLNYKAMERIVKDIAKIKKQGKDIIIVTSGAIGAGMPELGVKIRPTTVKMQQACAAIGQNILMSKYEEFFSKYKIKIAQILLTYKDFSDKTGYTNLNNSINTLLELGIVPIINENDPVSINELGPSFGDNDKLSALLSCKIRAKMLLILTAVDGVYNKNPKLKEAKIIREVFHIDKKIESLQGGPDVLGLGGVKTKIAAAKIVTRCGILMVIANGRKKGMITSLMEGKKRGTIFYPAAKVEKKKGWIKFLHKIGFVFSCYGILV
tara:strand:+ start:9700 stop:10551 length:852 start_codon:yes stop_codon:yes gene_type:complete